MLPTIPAMSNIPIGIPSSTIPESDIWTPPYYKPILFRVPQAKKLAFGVD